jgi:hypothetical protein
VVVDDPSPGGGLIGERVGERGATAHRSVVGDDGVAHREDRAARVAKAQAQVDDRDVGFDLRVEAAHVVQRLHRDDDTGRCRDRHRFRRCNRRDGRAVAAGREVRRVVVEHDVIAQCVDAHVDRCCLQDRRGRGPDDEWGRGDRTIGRAHGRGQPRCEIGCERRRGGRQQADERRARRVGCRERGRGRGVPGTDGDDGGVVGPRLGATRRERGAQFGLPRGAREARRERHDEQRGAREAAASAPVWRRQPAALVAQPARARERGLQRTLGAKPLGDGHGALRRARRRPAATTSRRDRARRCR